MASLQHAVQRFSDCTAMPANSFMQESGAKEGFRMAYSVYRTILEHSRARSSMNHDFDLVIAHSDQRGRCDSPEDLWASVTHARAAWRRTNISQD